MTMTEPQAVLLTEEALATLKQGGGSFSSCMHCRLRDVPVQIGGIALNVAAIAGLLNRVSETYPGYESACSLIRSFMMFESWTLCLVCCVRALTCSRRLGRWRSTLTEELRSRRATAAHSTLLTALQLIAAQSLNPRPAGGLGRTSSAAPAPALAYGLVHVSWVLNTVLTVHFFRLCWRRRASVEPYWFPPGISVGRWVARSAP
jgi:hypothetical protein